MTRRIGHALACTLLLSVLAASASSQSNPASSLRDVLKALSHDSLGGRRTGSKGAASAANFIESSVARLGLLPGGDKSKFTQDVPAVHVRIDSTGTSLGGRATFTYGVDFQPIPGFGDLPFAQEADLATLIFGGRLGAPGAASPQSTVNKGVIFLPPLRSNGQPDYQIWNRVELLDSYKLTKTIFLVSLELMPASVRRAVDRGYFQLKDSRPKLVGAPSTHPAMVAISRATASMLIGIGAEAVEGNRTGIEAHGTYRQRLTDDSPDAPLRNVVAIVEGSDPALRSEYLVLSARLDQADASEGERDLLGVWPLDRDPISNGVSAASGAVALLEIARRFAADRIKPKRSVVFLWTVGSEYSRLGSEWFAAHTSIANDKIVANIDVDQIATRSGGNAGHELQIVGAKRLSNQLGEWLEETAKANAVSLDHRLDAPGHPDAYYCRGDHWTFARRGIPSLFVTNVSESEDDLDRIDFEKLAHTADFLGNLALDIANRAARPVVAKGRQDSKAACIQ